MSMDLVLEAWVSGLIELSKLKWMLGAGKRWTPGERIKLLFAGYNGNRNTGADVRVEEMLRQIRHVLGEENVDLSVLSHNLDLTRGYFDGVRQVKLPDIFPPFLFREMPKYDGVVACEGSMFKSKFANALTTMMIGSLAIASSQNKLSIGYGAEAGQMDPTLAWMCARYCNQSLIITRNEESGTLLTKLGISTELGTDTAWTFEPHGPEYSERALREAGWNGVDPVLAVCPINPFWWPVKASLVKAAAKTIFGAYKNSHYRSVYFHNSGPGVNAAFARYLTAIANAVACFRKETRVFPVLVAMEALDIRACGEIAQRLGGVPTFSSLDFTMYELVSILRRAQLIVSSRYHGIVTAMPSLVPSAGVTMDERIRNLMRERGHDHLLLQVDDPDLEERLIEVMRTLQKEQDSVREGIGLTVARNLKVMARMGVFFEEHLQRRYPEFPARGGVRSWEDYLPPLSPGLRSLVETYEGAAVAAGHRV
jgi:polysaccharide pyruvyl transferase WcaK-like protein